jgi:uncharacterized protein YbjQ (UPF0145 family)
MKMYSFFFLLSYGGIFILSLFLILLGFLVGTFLESSHFKSIKKREESLAHLVSTNLKKVPSGKKVTSFSLVKGEVVISSDYFKTMIASLKHIFGGRLTTMETLLDRARRESFLRMKEHAEKEDASMIINVRFETTSLGLARVEVLAYGTAVKFNQD